MTDENKGDKDLGTQGRQDTAKGKLDQAAGNVQKKWGELTNDPNQQREGEGKRMKGKVEEGGGNLERKVDDALDDE